MQYQVTREEANQTYRRYYGDSANEFDESQACMHVALQMFVDSLPEPTATPSRTILQIELDNGDVVTFDAASIVSVRTSRDKDLTLITLSNGETVQPKYVIREMVREAIGRIFSPTHTFKSVRFDTTTKGDEPCF